jgi:sodium-coupled neutral amino acid transporter 7/8
VIKIIGSLAALFIFFFPGLCLLRISTLEDGANDESSNKKTWLTVVAGAYLALGAFVFGLVLTQGIYVDFIYAEEVDIPVCIPLPLNSTRVYVENQITI